MKLKEDKQEPEGQSKINFFLDSGSKFDRRKVMDSAPDNIEDLRFTRTASESKQLLKSKYRKLLEYLRGNTASVLDVARYMNVSCKVAYTDLKYMEVFGLVREV